MVVFNYLICIDINMKRIIMIIFILMVFIEAPASNDSNIVNQYKLFEYYWAGIIQTESDGIHFKRWKIVTSSKGALGIAQVMPNTFWDVIRWSKRTDIKPKDIMIRKHNLWAGKWYFSNAYFNVYPYSKDKAISSYNRGINSKIMTWTYVNKVKINAKIINIRRKVDNGRWDYTVIYIKRD